MSGATQKEIDTMKHMLGFGHRSAKPGWRNYGCYAADDQHLLGMMKKGLVKLLRPTNGGRDAYYAVTESWAKTLGAEVKS